MSAECDAQGVGACATCPSAYDSGVSDGTGLRRKATRIPYPAEATVFVGSRQLTCRVVNLSADGVLIIPPNPIKPNQFVRLNISLPYLEEVLDLDGVVTRETRHEDDYGVVVQFHELPVASETLIRTFVRWAKLRKATPPPVAFTPGRTGPLPRYQPQRGGAAAPPPTRAHRVGPDGRRQRPYTGPARRAPSATKDRGLGPPPREVAITAPRRRFDSELNPIDDLPDIDPSAPRPTPARAVNAVPEELIRWTETQDLGKLYRAAMEELIDQQAEKKKAEMKKADKKKADKKKAERNGDG